jgi:hypothetical protein
MLARGYPLLSSALTGPTRALQDGLERLPLQQHVPQHVPGAAGRLRLQPTAQPLAATALAAAAARAPRPADM